METNPAFIYAREDWAFEKGLLSWIMLSDREMSVDELDHVIDLRREAIEKSIYL